MPQKRQLDYKEIVRLRDEEGLSFEAIGERLGSGRSAIYRAYGRAKGTYTDAKDGQSKPGRTRERTPDRTREDEDRSGRVCTQCTLEENLEEENQRASECTEGTREGTREEWEEVRRMLTWWRERQAYTQGTPEGTRARVPQTFRIREELLEALRSYAEKEGISTGEAVNRIMEAGLEVI